MRDTAHTQQGGDADVCLHCQVVKVDFAPQHALSYNELIGLVKFNILTSDWGDEDHAESILSERRSQWSSQMFKNIRCAESLSSCPEGGGRTDALMPLAFIGECMAKKGRGWTNPTLSDALLSRWLALL